MRDSFKRPLHLIDLRDVDGYYSLNVINDSYIGGLSEAAIEMTENGIEFRGKIDAERADKMAEIPNVTFLPPQYWKGLGFKHNCLRIEARRLAIPEVVEPRDRDKVLQVLIKLNVYNMNVPEPVELFVS